MNATQETMYLKDLIRKFLNKDASFRDLRDAVGMDSEYNLLPSEAESALEKALGLWEREGRMEIYEPCNCGSQIRHNNGGNYHKEIYLRRDSNRVFVKYGTTCELSPSAPWEEISAIEAEAIIRDYADWL
jgi:hypothetical protein